MTKEHLNFCIPTLKGDNFVEESGISKATAIVVQ